MWEVVKLSDCESQPLILIDKSKDINKLLYLMKSNKSGANYVITNNKGDVIIKNNEYDK